MRTFCRAAASLGAVLVVSVAAQADSISNGSFTANASLYDVNSGGAIGYNGASGNPAYPTSWGANGGFNDFGNATPNGGGGVNGPATADHTEAFAPATTGPTFGFLQNYNTSGQATYYQTFATVSGTTYTVRYSDAERGGDIDNGSVIVEIEDGGYVAPTLDGTTSVTNAGNSQSVSVPVPTAGYLAYQADSPSETSFVAEPTFTFTAQSATSTIILENTYDTAAGDAIDHTADFTAVSVTAVVPEPATMSLLSLGIPLLLRRRARPGAR
jgi:hypothetical protein